MSQQCQNATVMERMHLLDPHMITLYCIHIGIYRYVGMYNYCVRVCITRETINFKYLSFSKEKGRIH